MPLSWKKFPSEHSMMASSKKSTSHFNSMRLKPTSQTMSVTVSLSTASRTLAVSSTTTASNMLGTFATVALLVQMSTFKRLPRRLTTSAKELCEQIYYQEKKQTSQKIRKQNRYNFPYRILCMINFGHIITGN